jgi:ABC-type transport system substrate-binding protein
MSSALVWRRVAICGALIFTLAATGRPPVLAKPAHRAAAVRGHAPVRCPRRNVATGSIAIGSDDGTPPFFLADYLTNVFSVDAKGRPFTEMATELPTVRNGGIRSGGRTYVVHLKPGMFWSNGAEITSADAAFGWKVAYDPAGGPFCSPYCPVTAVDTPGRYTAVYHLSTVDYPFLLRDLPLLFPPVWPGDWNRDAHAAVLKLTSNSWDWSGPTYPTDGPYQVVSQVPTGQPLVTRVTLRPMKYYDVMSCGAYIQRITLTNYSGASDAARLQALHAGKFDLSDTYGLTQLPDVMLSRDLYRVHVDPVPSIEHIEFNVDPVYNGKPNPLHDTRVRRALALALDKRSLIETALGVNARQATNLMQWSFCPRSGKYQSSCADRSISGQWDPVAGRYDPNPGRGVALLDAKRILSETPWRHGFTLDAISRAYNRFGPVEVAEMASSWKRIGVELNINPVNSLSTLFADYDHGGPLAHGQFQVVAIQFNLSSTGLDSFLQQSLLGGSVARHVPVHNANQQNYSGFSDPVINLAIRTAETTVDEKVRRKALNAAQEELARQAYWDVLYCAAYIYTEDGRIAGLSDSIDSTSGHAPLIYWNMWNWRVKKP